MAEKRHHGYVCATAFGLLAVDRGKYALLPFRIKGN